jgi:hypothetical protein
MAKIKFLGAGDEMDCTDACKKHNFATMKNDKIHIDFNILGPAMREYVRAKAIKCSGSIVYKEGRFLIQENPKTKEKKILKEYQQA